MNTMTGSLQIFKPGTVVSYNGKSQIVEHITIKNNVIMVSMYGIKKEVPSTKLTCEPTILSYTRSDPHEAKD